MRKQGFTLIEMLVVASLIMLFATMMMFSVSTHVQRAKEQATLGEMRSLASAIALARRHVGFYPKLAFLDRDREEIVGYYNQLEYYGFDMSYQQYMINRQWRGPYYGLDVAGRKRVMRAGGVVTMRLPLTNEDFDWPADAFGNPYVVYLMTGTENDPKFITTAQEYPDYFAAVVSYGMNKVPGGGIISDQGKMERLFTTIDESRKVYRLLDSPAAYADEASGRAAAQLRIEASDTDDFIIPIQ